MKVYLENPEDVVSTAEKNIEERHLLEGVARLGLAVSGGADSMALLEVVPGVCSRVGVECAVLFVHHGRPGEDEAQELVRKAAARVGLPFFSRHCPIEDSVRSGVSIENVAREVRLTALAEMAEEGALDTVATAHHADDVAETLLLRMIRGSGLSGLAGIRWRSENGKIRVIRPLLNLSHLALTAFLRERSLSWVEDPDNECFTSMRVRMRRAVIPEMEKILYMNVRRALCRTAEFLREEEEAAAHGTARRLDELCDEDGALEAAGIAALPLSEQRRVLREWLFAGKAECGAGWQTIADLVAKVQAGGRWAVSLGRDKRVVSSRGKIRLECK